MSVDPSSKGAANSPLVIDGIVLAAGESSRMGTDKALLVYRGKTFLENIISTLREAGVRRVVVVLGHHADLIQQSIDLSAVQIVIHQDYRMGQTSSLQAGLRVLAGKQPDGVLLCLADHPAISANTVQVLIQSFKSAGSPVVIPQLEGKHGHPVLLSSEAFLQILTLGSNEGADTVIHRFRPQTLFVDVADPGILLDVDDPGSYVKLATQT